MSRNRFLFTFLSVAILLTMVLVACAPAAPAKPATPPATTTPPAAKPPAATTPPAPPAPPTPPPATTATPIKTSYAAKTYTNDQYGFSFLYPSTMAVGKPTAKYSVFSAADAMQVPTVGADILDTAKVDAQTEEGLTGVGGSDIKVVSSEPVTLTDGKTKASYTILTWKMTGYNITTHSMAVEKGDKTISVSYTSLTDMIDAKIAKEVVSTLTLK